MQVILIFFREFSVEGIIHLSQDFSLLCAHILVMLFRDSTFNKASVNFFGPSRLSKKKVDYPPTFSFQDLCITAAIGIQFFFLARFAFMLLETVQTFAILTNVINENGYFTRKINLAIGWTIPIVITSVSAMKYYQEYPSQWS